MIRKMPLLSITGLKTSFEIIQWDVNHEIHIQKHI